MKLSYKKIIAFLFFIFFTTPILSPSFNGFTIYLYWFIPLLDLNFIKYLFKTKFKKQYLIIIGIIVFISILFGRIILAVKLLSLIEVLIYLYYCKIEKTFKYLYLGMNFNIIIALLQFIFYYISPNVSIFLGPKNISTLIWGKYATETNTNLYAIFNFVRASGWSREAGFFASLLTICFVTYYYDNDVKKSKFQYILFIIGYIVSFSKASVAIILLFIISYLKKYIDYIPYFIGVIITIVFMVLFSNYLQSHNYYNSKNESIIHRFSGYSVIKDLSLNELFFGVNKIENINEYTLIKHNYLSYIYKFEEFCGIPQLIINNGFIIFILFILMLWLMKLKFSDFLFITVSTITLDYFASTSFVVLAYFFVIYRIYFKKN